MAPRRHGTRYCFTLGCRLPECVAANREYRRFAETRQTLQHRYTEGKWASALVDPAEAHMQVLALRACGFSSSSIARETGVAVRTVKNIALSRHRPRRPTADAIRELYVRVGAAAVGHISDCAKVQRARYLELANAFVHMMTWRPVRSASGPVFDAIAALLGEDEVTTWRAEGACRGPNVDPTWFYPTRGESSEAARAICNSCPVEDECLDWALTKPEKFGMWGGLSERERRRIRLADRRLAAQVEDWELDEDEAPDDHPAAVA